MEDRGRYLLLSWRLRPPYLLYTTVCALVALGLLLFNLFQGLTQLSLPTWRNHPLEEGLELGLCAAIVIEVALTARLIGRKAFLANLWCVFDMCVAALSILSMGYALVHIGKDGEVAQASLPFLVLRFLLQPMRFCALLNQTLQARSMHELEPVSFTQRTEELLGESARVEESVRCAADYA